MKKLFSDNLYILIFLSIGLLAMAILDWAIFHGLPYGFFTFLRWLITICAAWTGYRIFNKDSKSKMLILFGIITVLFNPIIPVFLNRETWTLIDFTTAIILLTFLIKGFKNENL